MALLRRLRHDLGLSRAELARFLGMSEATVVRWESDHAMSEPKGLQAVLLQALIESAATHDPAEVARIIRSCGVDHRAALKRLLQLAKGNGRNGHSPLDAHRRTE